MKWKRAFERLRRCEAHQHIHSKKSSQGGSRCRISVKPMPPQVKSRRPCFTVGRAWMIKIYEHKEPRHRCTSTRTQCTFALAKERRRQTNAMKIEKKATNNNGNTKKLLRRDLCGSVCVCVLGMTVCSGSHTHTAAFVLRTPSHIMIAPTSHTGPCERTCVIVSFMCIFFVGFRLVLFIPYAQHSTALRCPYEFSNDLFVLSYCSVYTVCVPEILYDSGRL